MALVFRTIATLLANKLFALYFGAPGITLLTHFQNLIAIATQLSDQGTSSGMLKYNAVQGVDEASRQRLVKSTWWLGFSICIAVLACLGIFKNYFFAHFGGVVPFWVFYIILVIGAVLIWVKTFVLAILRSEHNFKGFAILTALNMSAFAFGVYWGTTTGSITQALLAFAIGQGAGAVISVVYIGVKKAMVFSRPAIHRSDAARLWQFILMAVAVLVFERFTDFVARDYAISTFGVEATGLWQAMARLAAYIQMVFVASIGLVLYPQVAAIAHSHIQLRRYLWSAYRLIIPGVFIGLLIIYLLRTPMLVLLFSDRFVEAGSMAAPQLFGEGLLMLGLPLAYTRSILTDLKGFTLAYALPAFLYLGLVYFVAPSQGIAFLPIAYACRQGLFVVLLVAINYRVLFDRLGG